MVKRKHFFNTKTLPKLLKNFKADNRGVAYIYVVAIATLIFFPIVYMALTFALDSTVAVLFSTYSLSGWPLSAWTLAKGIVSALPVFVIFTIILWSFVNSKAKGYEA